MGIDKKNTSFADGAPMRINGEELHFPVTFRLKAVFTTVLSDRENKNRLVRIFDHLKIGYLYYNANRSSKGNYVSFTYEITVGDRPTLQRLYDRLNEIDNLKFAL